MSKMKFDLQFFAGAGSNVNASDSMVNAYTGASTPRGDANAMEHELKVFYDTELLENASPRMLYGQLGVRQPLPENHGDTVEWRRFNTFPCADKLQEGVIPEGKDMGTSKIVGTVEQYGIYTTVTDRLEMHACDDLILAAARELGNSAAKTGEALIRNALLTGTNVLYCDNVDLSTGASVGTPTSCAEMEASATRMSKLTPEMVNKAATILRKNNAPGFSDNLYVAVIHPSVAYDFKNCPAWQKANEHTKAVFKGEIGTLYGVRFIENPFAPVLRTVGETDYSNKAGGATYASYFFGFGSYGIVDPEGGGLEMVIHDKGEIGGPLNQFSTIGYKLETNGASILYPERILRVMSCSSFSATDESNY